MLIRAIVAATILAAVHVLPAAAQEGKRELTNVAGDVWRFQNSFHFSLVVVTDDGVVVVDPINAEAAEALKAEIDSRFGKPITHLVYSHSHGDHASGGAVFAAPNVIAEANAPAEIDGVAPTMHVSEPTSIAVGGKTLEFTPLGPGHGTDMMAMVVRPENVAFIVDVVSPGRLPYRDFPGADIAGLIEQTKKVEALDFDILAPGHSRLGDKSDATAAREYVEWLRSAVAAEMKAGRPVTDIVASLDTTAYQDWMAYGTWRDLNIEGMARWLKESGEVQ